MQLHKTAGADHIKILLRLAPTEGAPQLPSSSSTSKILRMCLSTTLGQAQVTMKLIKAWAKKQVSPSSRTPQAGKLENPRLCPIHSHL